MMENSTEFRSMAWIGALALLFGAFFMPRDKTQHVADAALIFLLVFHLIAAIYAVAEAHTTEPRND